jgi:hypothetical protein
VHAVLRNPEERKAVGALFVAWTDCLAAPERNRAADGLKIACAQVEAMF